MLKKTIYGFLILLVWLNINSTSYINSLYGSNWEFMEDTFIVKPKTRYSRISNLLKTGVLSTGALFAGRKIYKYLAKKDASDYNLNKEMHLKRMRLSGLTFGLLTAGISYKLLSEHQEDNIEYDSLRRFVASWGTNKANTPQELHKTFDSLANIYINNRSEFDENYKDVSRLIKKAIYKKFPKKYVQEDLESDKKGFWNSKVLLGHVDFSFGGVLNSIANLIRAISGR